ncbi:Mu transposase C-terminal domain-containing protein [Chryseosolibacter indicus]|uniref:Mu transposase C-terminal domain-containing protein n=1 Tax=Chryseosolibacter indicus TaxID=2782351 RepID=A0ABS5VNA7_9BACT|nr:Mu transposase C-terminal domain-containing protein [Chryseosolibacter indicus]MBT1702924.1 Mu transposase C-terminal domain-containing protein [Chryseosolibacter indicus]
MKLLDNILYIEWHEAIDSGISKGTLDAARNRKSPSWLFIDDPEDRRSVLIGFEKLKDEYKRKIEARFGNPYEFIAKQPIRKLVKWDDKAEEFFLAYRYDENKKLPIETVKKYTVAANWLNMLKEVNNDKKQIKKLLNLQIEQFYDKVIEIIKAKDILDQLDEVKAKLEVAGASEVGILQNQLAHLKNIYLKEKIDLPTSYRRLVVNQDSALKKYLRDGYASIIDWRFGNKLAAKIKDEVSEAVLLEMLAHHNQYDDVFITMQYNRWAKEHGYKAIDESTVGVWRRKREDEIIMFREGNAALKSKVLRVVKGTRPTAPLYLVESDDNVIDLYFIDAEEENHGKKYTKRYVSIVVTDSFNDYVLGYAYAVAGTLDDGGTIALIHAAYLNAMYYIRSITGSWFLPHEVKTDNWGIATLEPYYRSIANYVKTPVGSKNRGYIENFFGSPHWKRCLKIGANNYTGNNITAKNRGVNDEMVKAFKKERPLIGTEAEAQLENFFHRLRYLPQSNGISKHQQWLEAWNALPDTQKRLMNDEKFLLTFGINHLPKSGELPRLTNRGLDIQIGNQRYSYDILGGTPLEHLNKKVHVYYDPYDLSRVLITDKEQVRLIGVDAQRSPRALHDHVEGSRTYLNALLAEKQNTVNQIAEKSERRKKTLALSGIDAESLLNDGVMVKQLKRDAEQKVLSQLIDGPVNDDDLYDQM